MKYCAQMSASVAYAFSCKPYKSKYIHNSCIYWCLSSVNSHVLLQTGILRSSQATQATFYVSLHCDGARVNWNCFSSKYQVAKKAFFKAFTRCVSNGGLSDHVTLISFNHTCCINFVFHWHLVISASSTRLWKYFHYVSSCACSDYFF